ncbi:MAG: ABC transporter permease [Motilibacteraceae bacterium]
MTSHPLAALAVAVVLLAGVAGAVGHLAGLGHGRDLVVATGRAVVQLLLVGLVVRVVLGTPALAPLYLAVMLTAAALTSGRRLRGVPEAARLAAVAIGSGALVTTVVVFATGALAWSARDVVPFTAQVLGGAMTATTLAGQRLLDDVRTQWDQVEAWLAVGATPRQAVRELGRVAAARALVPSLDQTRNVGLVVLPGAFVGLLLGGASPLEAGRVQLLVLVGLLAAQTVAAVVVTRLLADRVGLVRPVVAA